MEFGLGLAHIAAAKKTLARVDSAMQWQRGCRLKGLYLGICRIDSKWPGEQPATAELNNAVGRG
jgi:hypothetical protein